MAKWDEKVIEELLEEGEIDKVAEYAAKPMYAKIIPELLKKHPVATPQDLAKIAYPLLSFRVKNPDLVQIDDILKSMSDYISAYDEIQASGLRVNEAKQRFYTALARFIGANEDYALYEFLLSKKFSVPPGSLARGIKSYPSFLEEVRRRRNERERR